MSEDPEIPVTNMSEEPEKRSSFFKRGSIFGESSPSKKRLSISEEFKAYQAAVKRASLHNETVVGVDQDGVAMTVPVVPLTPTKSGEKQNLFEVVESMLNGELNPYRTA
jgi:hypothetical protein